MSRIEAIHEIIHDARTERSSKASLKRLRKAGRALSLSQEEQLQLELLLDYRNRYNGDELYPKFV